MKNKIIITSLASALLVGGCNGGNSVSPSNTTSKMEPVVKDVYVPEGLQAKTVASVSAGTQTGALKLNAVNNCFQIVPTNGKPFITELGSSNNQWWSTASVKFTMKNTCSSAQSLIALPIKLKNVSLNGKALTSVGDIAQSGSPYLTVSGQVSGAEVLVSASTPACSGEWCSWAQVPAGGTHMFTVNTSLSGLISNLSLSEVVIDGSTPPPPPPVESTVLAVNVQSSSLTDLCKSAACNIKVKVISPDSQESTILVNPVESPNYTVRYHGILPGNYAMAVDQASLPAGVSYAYNPTTGVVSVNTGTTNTGVVTFSYTKPAELGNLKIALNTVSDSASNFNGIGDIYGQATDTNTGKVYTFNVPLGGSYSLPNVPANHKYTVTVQGIGNAQKGSYYAPITQSDITVTANQTKTVTLSYSKASNTQVTAFSLTGEKVAAQNVMFATEGNSYKLMTNNTLVSGNYTFIADQTTTITSDAPSGYNVTINPQVITNGVKTVTVNYIVKPKPTNNKYVATYWSSWGGNTAYSDAYGGSFPTPYVALDKIPSYYNVLIYAFVETKPGSTSIPMLTPSYETAAQVKQEIANVHKEGRKVIVSVGGQNATFNINTTTDMNTFVQGMEAIINEYDFDGIDIDVEAGSMGSSAALFGQAVKQIAIDCRKNKPDFMVTAAPEWPLLTTNQWYGKFFDALGMDNVTVIWPQFYNQGPGNGITVSTDPWKTVSPNDGMDKFIVTAVWAFTTESGIKANNGFYRIPSDKLAIGLPAANGAAGGAGAYVTTSQQMKDAWANMNSRGLSAAGFMNWSADFDGLTRNVGNVRFNHQAWEFGKTASELVK